MMKRIPRVLRLGMLLLGGFLASAAAYAGGRLLLTDDAGTLDTEGQPAREPWLVALAATSPG